MRQYEIMQHAQVYPMFGYDKSQELRGRNVNALIPVRGVQGPVGWVHYHIKSIAS